MGQKRLTGDFAPVTVISENRKDDRKRNMIKHVLFDLDGTLLPMDQNEFVKYYMPLLAKRFVKYGMEPKALIGTIWKGVEARPTRMPSGNVLKKYPGFPKQR